MSGTTKISLRMQLNRLESTTQTQTTNPLNLICPQLVFYLWGTDVTTQNWILYLPDPFCSSKYVSILEARGRHLGWIEPEWRMAGQPWYSLRLFCTGRRQLIVNTIEFPVSQFKKRIDWCPSPIWWATGSHWLLHITVRCRHIPSEAPYVGLTDAARKVHSSQWWNVLQANRLPVEMDSKSQCWGTKKHAAN